MYAYTIDFEDIRYAAQLAGIRDLTDDECDEIAHVFVDDKFPDMLYGDISDVFYDLFPEREEEDE